jgi:hypothetical protein
MIHVEMDKVNNMVKHQNMVKQLGQQAIYSIIDRQTTP